MISEDDKVAASPDTLELFEELGAIHTPFGLQLRFPTRAMAENSLKTLKKKLPAARWRIVESTFGPIMD